MKTATELKASVASFFFEAISFSLVLGLLEGASLNVALNGGFGLAVIIRFYKFFRADKKNAKPN